MLWKTNILSSPNSIPRQCHITVFHFLKIPLTLWVSCSICCLFCVLAVSPWVSKRLCIVPFWSCFLDVEILPVLFPILPLVLRKGLAHRELGANLDFEGRTPEFKSHLNILKLKHPFCCLWTWSRAPQLAEREAWKRSLFQDGCVLTGSSTQVERENGHWRSVSWSPTLRNPNVRHSLFPQVTCSSGMSGESCWWGTAEILCPGSRRM